MPTIAPKRSTRTIRLFVSSTFDDLKAERNILQADVFPKLQQRCQAKGWTFQAIDLRWGVSTEAALDHSAMRICLGEIERCQAVTPRPNFLVLLGERYGWRPLPDAVSDAEFKALMPYLAPDVLRLLIWEDDRSDADQGWYRLDENAVIPLSNGLRLDRGEWRLRPRTGRFEDARTWNDEVERPIGTALRHAARQVWPEAADHRRLKFEASATEQEIVAGALKVADAAEHVCAALRSIVLPEGAAMSSQAQQAGGARFAGFIDLQPDGQHLDAEAAQSLRDLKYRLRNHLEARQGKELRHRSLIEYDATWDADGPTPAHLDAFANDVLQALQALVDAQIQSLEATSAGADDEPRQHWDFAQRRSRGFKGRNDDVQMILRHLRPGVDGKPLLVSAESGSGKSALLAQVARAALRDAARLDEANRPVVVARFIGATPVSGDLRLLIDSLCREIGIAYGRSSDNLPLEIAALGVELRLRLSELPSAKRPLLLFIDALDQLNASPTELLRWLPRDLGLSLRIVLSALPEPVAALRSVWPQLKFHELPPLSTDAAAALLDAWLARASRRLTDSQRSTVLRAFGASKRGLPLQLRMSFEQSRYWRSTDPVELVPELVTGQIEALLRRLKGSNGHNPLLIARTLAFLACSRQGLAELELLQLLAIDAAYWDSFVTQAHHALPRDDTGNPVRQLPVVVWLRLMHDLEPYVSWRQANGAAVMNFFHTTSFVPVVHSSFLKTEDERRALHAALAHYFVVAAHGAEGIGSAARWRSDDARGFAEAPYHRINAGDEDGSVALLTDLKFIAGKVRHGLAFDLLQDYRACFKLLPESRTELKKQLWRDHALVSWGKGISEFARLWEERRQSAEQGKPTDGPEPSLPAPPATVRMWSDEEIEMECRRRLEQPTRMDRLRQFEAFVRGQLHLLSEFADRTGFVVQHAIGTHLAGPVHDSALALAPASDVPMLLRRWPPSSTAVPMAALLQSLPGHSWKVLSVSVTPDGRRAISGAGDDTLRIWDLNDGVCLRTLIGHSGWVRSVALTPDGRHAVSGSEDKTLRVWDVESGACIRTLYGHSRYVTTVSMTPDGKRAISGSDDATLRVWDLKSGTCLRTLVGHSDYVTAVGVTPDGRLAVSGSKDTTLRVWDMESGACLRAFRGHSDEVNSVCVVPHGRLAVSGSDDKTLRVWNLMNGDCLCTIEGHRREVWSLDVTPDGRRAVSGDRDGIVRVWDLWTGACLRTLEGHIGSFRSVRMTLDGRLVISGNNDGSLEVWNLENGANSRALEEENWNIICVSATSDGRRAVSGCDDNRLRVWDLESCDCLRTLEGHRTAVTCVSMSADGRFAVSGSSDATLRVWELETGACLSTLECGDSVSCVSLTPDGRRAVVGVAHTLQLWDLASGACLRKLRWFNDAFWSACVTPDGRHVMATGSDNTLQLWNLESGARLRTFRGHNDHVNSVCVTPDGRLAVSGSDDKTLRVWDIASGECLRTLKGHGDSVRSVSVTPDGRRTVSGSDDSTLRVWHLRSGICQVVFRAEAPILATAMTHEMLVAGTSAKRGGVLFLEAFHLPPGRSTVPKISTVVHEATLREGLAWGKSEKGSAVEVVRAHLLALAVHLEGMGRTGEARSLRLEHDRIK